VIPGQPARTPLVCADSAELSGWQNCALQVLWHVHVDIVDTSFRITIASNPLAFGKPGKSHMYKDRNSVNALSQVRCS